MLELAYLTSSTDITNMDNNMDKYTDAIANTFEKQFIASVSNNQ